jgi:hypothetical protein
VSMTRRVARFAHDAELVPPSPALPVSCFLSDTGGSNRHARPSGPWPRGQKEAMDGC